MRKLFLLITLFGSSSYTHKISHVVTYTPLNDQCEPIEDRGYIKIDNRKVQCFCGRNPVAMVMVYGHVRCFCYDHLHEIVGNGSKGLCNGSYS